MYKRELEKIDNPDKAYLLGLFYSDGNVSLNQNHCRITLHEKDVELLRKIQSIFKFFHIHRCVKRSQFTLYSGFLSFRKDLIDNGCLPQKSFQNKEKLVMPKLTDELLRHFIRGYFDRDGGCTVTFNSKKTQKRVYIFSANEILLNQIKEFLNKYNIKTASLRKNKVNVFMLTISTSSYKAFYNFLYSDTSLFINRKKETFNEVLKTNFFVQRKAPECKFCKSDKTVFDGHYSYKDIKLPRIWCKQCNRRHNINYCPCY